MTLSEYSVPEKEGDMRIWISYDTYRKLLRVRYFMTKKNGKLRTLDETIKELIEFWDNTHPNDRPESNLFNGSLQSSIMKIL